MTTQAWWQKPKVRQTWNFARVASLLMLVPLSVIIGIQLWRQAEHRRHLTETRIRGAWFSADGQTFLAFGYDGTGGRPWAAAWDAQTGALRQQRAVSLWEEPPPEAWADDPTVFPVGGQRTVRYDRERHLITLTDRAGKRLARASVRGLDADLVAARAEQNQIELLFRARRYVHRPDDPLKSTVAEIRRERWNPQTSILRPLWIVREPGWSKVARNGSRFAILAVDDTSSRLPFAAVYDGKSGKPVCRITPPKL